MLTEEDLRIKESIWEKEMLLLKNKYNALEDKLQQTIETEQERSTTASSQQTSCCKVMDKLIAMKEEISATSKGVTVLKNEVSGWFQSISEEVEKGRQYSQKNNVILDGFRNLPKLNNTDFIFFIADQLNYMFPSCSKFGRILPCHIDDAHPLGNRNGKSSVIVKFVNRWIRDKIIACQQDLRGTGIVVTEHLTKNTHKLLKSAQLIVGRENTWVFKCDVFALCNNKTMKIKNIRDIDKLKNCKAAGAEIPL